MIGCVDVSDGTFEPNDVYVLHIAFVSKYKLEIEAKESNHMPIQKVQEYELDIGCLETIY